MVRTTNIIKSIYGWLIKPIIMNRGLWLVFLIAISSCLYLLYLYPETQVGGGITLFSVVVAFIFSHYKKNEEWLTSGAIIFLIVSCVAVFRVEIGKYLSEGDVVTGAYQFRVVLSKGNIQYNGQPFYDVWLPESGATNYVLGSYSWSMGNLSMSVLEAMKNGTKKDVELLQSNFELALMCTESLILTDFHKRTMNGWGTQFIPIKISEGGDEADYNKPQNIELQNDVLKSSEIAKIFNENQLIKAVPIYQLTLPPQTDFEVKYSSRGSYYGLSSEWRLRNDFVAIKIIFRPKLDYGATGPVWGILDKGKSGRIIVVVGLFEAKFNSHREGNREMQYYKTWVKALKSSMEECDWTTIQNELDKEAVRRTAISVVH